VTARRNLFLAAAAVLGGVLVWGVLALPPEGTADGPYAALLVDLSVQQRSPNAVSGVLFDLRSSDTLGEALALFAASAALQMVLRGLPGEATRHRPRRAAPGRSAPPTSDAVRATALAFVLPTVAYAVYVAVRGHLGVGGGLQAGAVAVTALAMVFLAGRYRDQRAFAPDRPLDLGEAISMGGYVLLGLAAMVAGASFLGNVLPLGALDELVSSGTILALSLLVTIEAGAAVVLIVAELQEEPLERVGGEGEGAP
jgi:multicomponent Na+:H+ antiporter subunit B